MGDFHFEPIIVNASAPGGECVLRTFDDIGAFILTKIHAPHRQQGHWDAVRQNLAQARLGARRAEVHAATREAIRTLSPSKAATAFRLAFEAKLVGVNLPFLGNRRSVDAQYVALRRQLRGGFSADLDRAGLLKVFASKALEDKWTDELFELNREAYGKPGITKDAKALEIAKIVRKWQKQSMAMLNREGAWVRSYSGYVTRTSHDPHAIGKAGMSKWVNDTFDKLDLKRTFGTAD